MCSEARQRIWSSDPKKEFEVGGKILKKGTKSKQRSDENLNPASCKKSKTKSNNAITSTQNHSLSSQAQPQYYNHTFSQQYPLQQYPPQQFQPHQYLPQQYPPQQYPTQQYQSQQYHQPQYHPQQPLQQSLAHDSNLQNNLQTTNLSNVSAAISNNSPLDQSSASINDNDDETTCDGGPY
jgi:hypothetical protein